MSGKNETTDSAGAELVVEDTTFASNEALFKSVDNDLHDDIVKFWASATDSFLQMYSESKNDGSEDAIKCRMLAASRLSQLGLCMLNFYGSAAVVIASGKADGLACSAVNNVVADMVGRKVDEWIERAMKSQN